MTPPRFFKKFKRKPQRGHQRIFWLESRKPLKGGPKEIFEQNLEMFPLVPPSRFFSTQVKISLGPPFEISIEFRQKSLKNYNFYWKKILNNFEVFAKNCPLNPMSLPTSEIFKIFRVSPIWREVHWWTLIIIIFKQFDGEPFG